ncbi:hypothetical protein [Streptomyces ziwulingensis]|uniref:Secreted protein n=1 Tax=Streptomyces ziwulingensis TaxID=1045501 RepID=A0ABP9ATZ2_9ACTN
MRRTARPVRSVRRATRALSAVALAGAVLGLGAAPGFAEPGVPPEPPGPAVPEEFPDGGERPAPEEFSDAGERPAPEEFSGADEFPAPGKLPGPRERPAHGQPAAEVSPATVAPGATVTVSVSCPAGGRPAPGALEAVSQAFEDGAVELRKVPGGDDRAAGPAYRGTARIASAESFEEDPDAVGPDAAWTVDGDCPGAPGGEGRPWSATITVTEAGGGKRCPEPARPGGHCTPEPPCPEPDRPAGPCTSRPPCPEPVPHGEPCERPPAAHGVHAGQGGTFTDSVPALVAGGLLIAGSFGAAGHRLRLRLRDGAGDR